MEMDVPCPYPRFELWVCRAIHSYPKAIDGPAQPARFLREGDHINISTKIVNLSDSELTGQIELQLLDATTNQSVDGWFQNIQANQYFTVGRQSSESVVFNLQVPFPIQQARDLSDYCPARHIATARKTACPCSATGPW